jgi:hypothetical protein
MTGKVVAHEFPIEPRDTCNLHIPPHGGMRRAALA